MLLKILLNKNYDFSGWEVIPPSNIDVINTLSSVSDGVVIVLRLSEDEADSLVRSSKDKDSLMEELSNCESCGCVIAKLDYNEIRVENFVGGSHGY
ncbi:hypothetical protein ZPAH1_orf00171 [Aeromonas phage ZPAH1]|nr:hypothetical protein ASwh1_121 [Aeromonas phage Aswh_1]QQG33933.1 hypothetical protein ZPAH1_orf00171 [Aeromonas phage ZPAH1]